MLLLEILRFLFSRLILRHSTGRCVKVLSVNMGVTYIKLAQILAMQDYGKYFTKQDREDLLSICNDINPQPFPVIEKKLQEEYGGELYELFPFVDHTPAGAASVSQVHRAVTADGREVVLKIKRQDIAKKIDKDIAQMKRYVKILVKVTPLRNLCGGLAALDYYLEWLVQELDFHREMENMVRYAQFADSVNGKVSGCRNIEVTKLYQDLCRDDVIVMEYIPSPVLSHNYDSKTAMSGVNSYILLSFYALLQNKPVVFHGDPHAGNIYITSEGNVGFLDMGLIFALSESEARLTKELFLCVYKGDADALLTIILPWLQEKGSLCEKFKEDVREYCKNIIKKPVTYYFMDLLIICLSYNILPPKFLFEMAKAFACLNGMDAVYFDNMTGRQLLGDLVLSCVMDENMDRLHRAPKSMLKSLEYFCNGDNVAFVHEFTNCIHDIKALGDAASDAWAILRKSIPT